MSGSQHTVMIGKESYTVQRFRGLKALLAIAAVTRIGREVPGILNDAVKQYQDEHMVEVRESDSWLAARFTKEDFDLAEQRSGERVIKVPATVDTNQQILAALPQLLEEARKEVIRLLAILIVPNEELKTADKADAVEEKLDEYQEALLYDAEIDQLVDLILLAQDVIKEQLSDRKDKLGNLIGGLRSLLPGRSTLQTPTLRNGPEEPTSQMSTSEPPSSSTPSPPPTDGAETKSSTVTAGVS